MQCFENFGGGRFPQMPPPPLVVLLRPEVRLPLDQRIVCSDCCKKCRLQCLAHVVFSYLYCIAASCPWCLRPKLHICTACCSDS